MARDVGTSVFAAGKRQNIVACVREGKSENIHKAFLLRCTTVNRITAEK